MANKDLNTATREDLQAIPQMSQARAETIIHYRDTHGDFTSIEQLSEIPGIGATMAAQVGEYFSVGEGSNEAEEADDDGGAEEDENIEDEPEEDAGAEGQGAQQETKGGEKPSTQSRRTASKKRSSSGGASSGSAKRQG